MEQTASKPGHFGIPGSTLKLIAIFAMALDHTAWCLIDPQIIEKGLPIFPKLVPVSCLKLLPVLYALSYLFHLIGRMTFPLMLFFLTEGVTYTRNILRYAGTLLLFAFLSEIPFDLVFSSALFDPSMQNVFFTLFFSLIAIYAMRKWSKRPLLVLPIVGFCAAAAWLLKSDYGFWGVITACVMELLHQKKTEAYFFGCLTAGFFSLSEWGALLALPAVSAYNGKRGLKLKYIFYLFYPLHLLVLAALAKGLKIA